MLFIISREKCCCLYMANHFPKRLFTFLNFIYFITHAGIKNDISMSSFKTDILLILCLILSNPFPKCEKFQQQPLFNILC